MRISRRSFLKQSVFASSLLTFGNISCREQKISNTVKPNIIIIYADDLGYGDLSCFGGDILTPHIDSIAQSGIRFTDFYVSAPVCTPSRYSLLTGRYSQRTKHGLGPDEVIGPGDSHHLDKNELTIAQMLKQIGYRTGVFGKWHLGSKEKQHLPKHHGFDVFSGHIYGCVDYFAHIYGSLGNTWFINNKLAKDDGYTTDLITDYAISFIDKRKKTPYFLYLPYNAPHYGKSDPNNLPENTIIMSQFKYNGADVANTLQAPKEYLNRFSHIKDIYRRYYSAMVSSMDDNVGRLINHLKKTDQFDNTMIWFISDNGGYSESYFAHASNGMLRGQKATLYEGGSRVAAMVCWKNKIKPKQMIKQPLCNIDLMPTIASILKCSDYIEEEPIDGVDISKVLFEQAEFERDIFWEFRGSSAFRRGKWKLYNDELYDLDLDISEKNNVAEEYPDKYKELKNAHAFLRERLENN